VKFLLTRLVRGPINGTLSLVVENQTAAKRLRRVPNSGWGREVEAGAVTRLERELEQTGCCRAGDLHRESADPGEMSLIDPERAPSTVEKILRLAGESCARRRIMNYLRVELKVCEGCGALWLRAMNRGVYCLGCAVRLSEFPAPRMSRRGKRRAATRTVVCAGGGR